MFCCVARSNKDSHKECIHHVEKNGLLDSVEKELTSLYMKAQHLLIATGYLYVCQTYVLNPSESVCLVTLFSNMDTAVIQFLPHRFSQTLERCPSPVSSTAVPAWIKPSQTSTTDCAFIFMPLINIRKADRHERHIFVAVLWEYPMCTEKNEQYFRMKSNNNIHSNINADIFQVITKVHCLLYTF